MLLIDYNSEPTDNTWAGRMRVALLGRENNAGEKKQIKEIQRGDTEEQTKTTAERKVQS